MFINLAFDENDCEKISIYENENIRERIIGICEGRGIIDPNIQQRIVELVISQVKGIRPDI